jgi:hypothetical protein
MTAKARPLVSAAFLCERILTEKDNAQTFVRVVDVLIARVPDEKKAPVRFDIWLAVILKSGEAKGKFNLELRMSDPNGNVTDISDDIPVVLNGAEHGINVNILNIFNLSTEGLYWIDVLIDGEALTRVPFRMRLERTERPPRGRLTPSDAPATPPEQ